MGNEGSESLFSSSSRIPLSTSMRTFIILVSLVAIVSAQSKTLNFSLSILYASLMLVERASAMRWTILAFFTCNVLLLFLLGTYLFEDSKTLHLQLSKTFTCVILLNWYGSTVSWPVFKRQYLQLGFLQELANLIDMGIFQGQTILEYKSVFRLLF